MSSMQSSMELYTTCALLCISPMLKLPPVVMHYVTMYREVTSGRVSREMVLVVVVG